MARTAITLPTPPTAPPAMPTIWPFDSCALSDVSCVVGGGVALLAALLVALLVVVVVVRDVELVLVAMVDVVLELVVVLELLELARRIDVVACAIITTPDVPNATVAVIVL